MLKKIQTNVGYLAGGESPQTMLGTRPGASAIAVWATLQYFGFEGYKKIVKSCMKLTNRLFDEIQMIHGIRLVIKPTINVIGLKSDKIDITDLASALRQKGWAVALFPKHIRIVVMPHIKSAHIIAFIRDLKNIMRNYLRRSKL